jgi:predicted nucleic acid-binding protein
VSDFVLDASVTLSWCFEDEGDSYTDSVIDAFRTSQAVVPALWTFEVANGLAMAERRRRIRGEEAGELLRAVLELPIRMDSETNPGTLLEVASRARISAYDAAYLEVALRQGLPLATIDRQLRSAAGMVGVVLFSV